MTASKLYFRDLLGLGLLLSAIMVMLGIIFSILGAINYASDHDILAQTFFYEAIPLFFFMIPSLLLARVISRPAWIHDVEDYQLQMAKNFSLTH
ncbi:D-fructose-6-phosphate amidotransferase [Photobacterium nomapromontoriensis]|uniref:D-fructose-6-phosphate amidotransferase n=1 Tax=Photobacterium nomapromontoriensis TaxID=2910237 RepID=UPI003D0E3298